MTVKEVMHSMIYMMMAVWYDSGSALGILWFNSPFDKQINMGCTRYLIVSMKRKMYNPIPCFLLKISPHFMIHIPNINGSVHMYSKPILGIGVCFIIVKEIIEQTNNIYFNFIVYPFPCLWEGMLSLSWKYLLCKLSLWHRLNMYCID